MGFISRMTIVGAHVRARVTPLKTAMNIQASVFDGQACASPSRLGSNIVGAPSRHPTGMPHPLGIGIPVRDPDMRRTGPELSPILDNPRLQPDPLQGRIDSGDNAKHVKPERWATASMGRCQISQRPRLNSMPKQITEAEHWALQSSKSVAAETE